MFVLVVAVVPSFAIALPAVRHSTTASGYAKSNRLAVAAQPGRAWPNVKMSDVDSPAAVGSFDDVRDTAQRAGHLVIPDASSAGAHVAADSFSYECTVTDAAMCAAKATTDAALIAADSAHETATIAAEAATIAADASREAATIAADAARDAGAMQRPSRQMPHFGRSSADFSRDDFSRMNSSAGRGGGGGRRLRLNSSRSAILVWVCYRYDRTRLPSIVF